jgi:transcription initiation factor TFIID subunit 1
LKENEVRLIKLEKAINPILDDNDLVGFSYILNDITQHCKNLPKSAAFHIGVDRRKVLDYRLKGFTDPLCSSLPITRRSPILWTSAQSNKK